jgi:hypothetical protein
MRLLFSFTPTPGPLAPLPLGPGLISHVCSARNCCDCEKIDLEILTDLQPALKVMVFGCRLYVCISLAPEGLDGFYSHSVSESPSVVGRCQVNMNILRVKIGVRQMSTSKHKIAIFSKTSPTILIKFQ